MALPTLNVQYAGFSERAGALVIDVIILSVPSAIIGVLFSLVFANQMSMGGVDEVSSAMGGNLWAQIWGNALAWVYYATMESSRFQGTLGKVAVGLKVVDCNMGRLTFGRATQRFFGRYLSAIPVGAGFFVQPFTERRQTWHDMLASCYVIKNFDRKGILTMDNSQKRGTRLTSDSSAGSEPPPESEEDGTSTKETFQVDHATTGDSSATNGSCLVSEEEERAYCQAKEELASGNIRGGLWIKVTTEESEKDQQESKYIQHRVTQLIDLARLEEIQNHRARRSAWRGYVSRRILKAVLMVVLGFGVSVPLLVLAIEFNEGLLGLLPALTFFLPLLWAPIYLIRGIRQEAKRRKQDSNNE